MLRLPHRLMRWWHAGTGRAAAPVPYEVVCCCGQVSRGERQARHQIIPCPGCHRRLFILPYSPWPPLDSAPLLLAPAGPRRSWHILKGRLAAAFLAVAILLVLLGLICLHRRPDLPPSSNASLPIGTLIASGQKALAEGKFTTAARDLQAAQYLCSRHPQGVEFSQRRQVDQLYRQAALLAELLAESLEEIVQHGAAVAREDELEWQQQFSKRYRGKAILLEAEVRRDATGRYELGWEMMAAGQKARIELADLKLLRSLPLENPQRLFFGARLAGVHLEAGGSWVIQLEPDSGVLMTEPGAVRACRHGQALEAKVLATLQAQQQWVNESP